MELAVIWAGPFCGALLGDRIRAFAALPFAELDRISLQKAVDDIARDH